MLSKCKASLEGSSPSTALIGGSGSTSSTAPVTELRLAEMIPVPPFPVHAESLTLPASYWDDNLHWDHWSEGLKFGPDGSSCSHVSVAGNAAEELVRILRERPLPKDLEGSELDLRLADVQRCVQSLYIDRLRPTLAEVRRRLCEQGWSPAKLQLLLPICASRPDLF